jgi:spore coat polysaccharide biosynthesis protein SpsF (cytidylyltransferase family)
VNRNIVKKKVSTKMQQVQKFLKKVEEEKMAKYCLSPIKEFDRDEEFLTTCNNEEDEYFSFRMEGEETLI